MLAIQVISNNFDLFSHFWQNIFRLPHLPSDLIFEIWSKSVLFTWRKVYLKDWHIKGLADTSPPYGWKYSNLITNFTLTRFCNLGTENGYTFHPQTIPPYNALGMCNQLSLQLTLVLAAIHCIAWLGLTQQYHINYLLMSHLKWEK